MKEMGKGIGLIALILVGFLILVNPAQADDGGPNTDFWVKDNKVACVTVLNPENLDANYFLVWEYSKIMAARMGRTETRVEKGKCYELDDGAEMYMVDKNGTKTDMGLSGYSGGFGVSNYDRYHYFGFNGDNLFPTKYYLGAPVISFSSSDDLQYGEMLTNKLFTDMRSAYLNLAVKMEQQIQNCDQRKRIEFRYAVTRNKKEIESVAVVWKMNDGSEKIMDEIYPDSEDGLEKVLDRVQLIGCQKTVSDFIKTNESDFQNFDILATKFKNNYPDIGVAFLRDTNDISKIKAFANFTWILPTPTKNITRTTEIKVVTTSLPEPTEVIDWEARKVLDIQMDEPTVEKKMERVQKGTAWLKMYFSLPVIIFAGLAYLILEKKILK